MSGDKPTQTLYPICGFSNMFNQPQQSYQTKLGIPSAWPVSWGTSEENVRAAIEPPCAWETPPPAMEQGNTPGTICTVHMLATNKMSFAWQYSGCEGVSSARWADFSRLYKSNHASNPPKYWCSINDCARSKEAGDYWFTRSDKRDDHMRKLHRSRVLGFAQLVE